MVDAVADEMDERVFHLFEDALVDLGFAAAKDDFGFLALFPAKIADDFRQDVQRGRERQHQQALRVVEEIVHHAADVVVVLLRGFGEQLQPGFEDRKSTRLNSSHRT